MGAERLRGPWPPAVVLALCLPGAALAHDVGVSRYDFTRDVRPIFLRHCASCHRPGGVAPMSLLRYEEASPWVNAIKLMVLERRMPPWLPDEGLVSLREAKGLTAPELDRVVEWASGGAPRGEGREEEGEGVPEGRQPDLLLHALEETTLSPEEVEKTDCVVFPVRLPRGQAIVGLSLQPGPESLLRGAIVYGGGTCGEEERPLATWLPGDRVFRMPEGTAEILDGKARLSARILLRKSWSHQGRPFRERVGLGLHLAKAPPRRLAHVNLAPGSPTTFGRTVRVVALFPQGPKGASVGLTVLRRPGGARERIFAIERLDPDWRAKYVLETPLELPAGAQLEAVGGGFWVDYLTAASLKASPPRAASSGSP